MVDCTIDCVVDFAVDCMVSVILCIVDCAVDCTVDCMVFVILYIVDCVIDCCMVYCTNYDFSSMMLLNFSVLSTFVMFTFQIFSPFYDHFYFFPKKKIVMYCFDF